jgi:type II secretory pathway pseudopilin PulG
MLKTERGFTVIQFIVAMTIGGLLLVGIFVVVAQRSWRDDQRRKDLSQVDAMIERYAANNLGAYPTTKDADSPSSQLQQQFQALHLVDPKNGKYYVLGSDFGDCNPTADQTGHGPGYISYGRPGVNAPFKLRVCLEWGDFSLGN